MNKKFSRRTFFLENILQDAFLFVFFLLLLSGYRIAFLCLFNDLLLSSTTAQEIGLTLWYGLRISLKTAGAIFLPSFVFATLLQQVFPRWKADKFRFVWLCFAVTLLSLLFQARIPYYQEFQNAFSPFVFNTVHDDMWAITVTAIQQYNAVGRVLLGLILAGALSWVGKLFLKTGKKAGARLAGTPHKTVWVILLCVLLVPTAIFVRRGGSFDFDGSIYWKNAARMKQHLLNEAILDDVQALYKASRIYKQFAKFSKNVTEQEVRQAAARISRQEEYTQDSLLPLLQQTAQGSALEKPQHIFVIAAETYMLWPLLEQYSHLPIASEMRRLTQRPDSILLDRFLPAANGTMFGVTAILLGLPELNLLTANRPSAQTPYETALSVQLKKQGYKTRFFYGGFPSWENIGLFMKNQQMDESFYFSELGGKGGVWGVKDDIMFHHAAEKISAEPSFNFFLTSTNHSPYTLNTQEEAHITPRKELQKFIPADTANEDLLLQRMQHFEYADYHLAHFITQMYQKYPNSLFIITGDHASRWTLSANPTLHEKLSVPLIIIGKGITKQMLGAQAAGSHMDIAATVLELVLPAGTPYYALGKSVLNQQTLGLHAYHWISKDALGTHHSKEIEYTQTAQKPLSEEKRKEIEQRLKDYQTIAIWRILNGTDLK